MPQLILNIDRTLRKGSIYPNRLRIWKNPGTLSQEKNFLSYDVIYLGRNEIVKISITISFTALIENLYEKQSASQLEVLPRRALSFSISFDFIKAIRRPIKLPGFGEHSPSQSGNTRNHGKYLLQTRRSWVSLTVLGLSILRNDFFDFL